MLTGTYNGASTEEANTSHYSGSQPRWVSGNAKPINRGYGKQGRANTNEGMGSQAGGLLGSLPLVANNGSQDCCQQQAQSH
jgi:hypothetical protein